MDFSTGLLTFIDGKAQSKVLIWAYLLHWVFIKARKSWIAYLDIILIFAFLSGSIRFYLG